MESCGEYVVAGERLDQVVLELERRGLKETTSILCECGGGLAVARRESGDGAIVRITLPKE